MPRARGRPGPLPHEGQEMAAVRPGDPRAGRSRVKERQREA